MPFDCTLACTPFANETSLNNEYSVATCNITSLNG